jgi:flavin reductase (DIM6/NTAB) family NADH-FMN oxidoreductase RutF
MTRRAAPHAAPSPAPSPAPAAASDPAGAGPQPQQLRAALGRFATGITVVTCCDEQGHWLGLTVNSFNALSLQPPLVLWSLRHASASLQAFVTSRRFAVNVLAANQSALSHRFAAPDGDKFTTEAWRLGVHGAPVLKVCAAVFECETVSHQPAGDHELFIGRVLSCSQAELPPLLYNAGHYHRLGSRLKVDSQGDEIADDEL